MKTMEAIYADDLSAKAVAIYRYLLDRQGKHENCYPSHKTIAMHMNCSTSTVKRAINELVRNGYVEKINRRRSNGSKTSNSYICKTPNRLI